MRRWDGLVDRYLAECERRGLAAVSVERIHRELERFGAWAKRRRPRPSLEEIDAYQLKYYVPNFGRIKVGWKGDDSTHEELELIESKQLSEEELAEVRALQSEMQAAFERRDLPNYYRLNAHVHDLLSQAARNPVLRQTWQQLNARLHALRFRSNQNETKWALALREHAAMIDALEARDGAALRVLLVQHLQRKRDAVLEQMYAVHEG